MRYSIMVLGLVALCFVAGCKTTKQIKSENAEIYIRDYAEFQGKQYCVLNIGYRDNSLWVIDKDEQIKKVLDESDFSSLEAKATTKLKFDTGKEFANHTRGVMDLQTVNNTLYFTYSNGSASERLFQHNKNGINVVEGVTGVDGIANWQQKLCFWGIGEDGKKGFFKVDSTTNKPYLFLECSVSSYVYIKDGGKTNTFPVMDSLMFVKVTGKPCAIMPSGKFGMFKMNDKLGFGHVAQLDSGLFVELKSRFRVVGEEKREYIILLKSSDRAISSEDLPEFMHGYNPCNIRSINGAVYFNLTSPNGAKKSLYFKNINDNKDFTDIFRKYEIEVTDLVTQLNRCLIISKKMDIGEGVAKVLMSFNLDTHELTKITSKGKPMGINSGSKVFKHNGFLYFVGSNVDTQDCLWCYNGIKEPERVKLKL